MTGGSKRAKEHPCPNAKGHTKHPEGYIAHAEWAEKKLKTHYQVRCPSCGLWAIWKPRSKERTLS